MDDAVVETHLCVLSSKILNHFPLTTKQTASEESSPCGSSSIHSSVHSGRYTFFHTKYTKMAPTSPVRNIHTPRVSSPLSPTQNDEQPCRVARRRSSRSGRKPNTLCARLLRARAQDSWRNHVLSAQVAQYQPDVVDQECKSSVSH